MAYSSSPTKNTENFVYQIAKPKTLNPKLLGKS